MSIHVAQIKRKLNIGNQKVKKAYKGADPVYSAGSSVTYHTDNGITYQEELNEGESCLSPKTFTPAKSGWTFVGWRRDTAAPAAGSVESSVSMGSSPITLYAVFRKLITVTYYNNSTSAGSTSGYQYYNNGNVANPSFTLTQAVISGWTARGWSTSTGASGGITYNNGAAFSRDANITLYGMYYQTITLTTYNGSSSASAHSGTRYYCPGSGSVVNPTFTVGAAALSGWSFNGWCTSSGATAGISYGSISGLALAANLTLYGRYSQAITLSYNGNGASGGSVATQSGTRYWNSGNVANPTFTLQANGFTRSGYNFTAWALNGGTQYAAGTSVSLAASATMYAVWTAIPATPFYLSGKNLTYTPSGNVDGWYQPTSGRPYWYIKRNGYYAHCQTSAFSRQNCTKVKFICYRDNGYLYIGNKTIDLRGKYSGTGEYVEIDISDQPDIIICAIRAEGVGSGTGDQANVVQISDPYFY